MKKIILVLALSTVAVFANSATINTTMNAMNQGMQKIQSGFMYNNKEEIKQGIKAIESANDTFSKIDVSKFIAKNHKIQVTNNINKNLAKDLSALKKAINTSRYSDATKEYAKVVNDCLSCHTIIRGW